MTEQQWQVSIEPRPLWRFLAQETSQRKWDLFACACCRRLRGLLKRRWPDHAMIEEAERQAESERTDWPRPDSREATHVAASHLALAVAQDDHEELVWQTSLIRCVFGNPFRSIPIDLAWRTPTVLALAAAAYDNRDLSTGTLDATRLSVLADALEDADCTDSAVLNHLRDPGPHVRGCHVLDALLGRS